MLMGEMTLEPANKALIFHNQCPLSDREEWRHPPAPRPRPKTGMESKTLP